MYLKLNDISIPQDFFDADRWYVCDVISMPREIHVCIMIPGYKSYEDARTKRQTSSFLLTGEDLRHMLFKNEKGKAICPSLDVAIADN